MKREVYVVGEYRGSVPDVGTIWLFHGVFTKREYAENRCRDGNFFVGPAAINSILPDDPIVWPGLYYPKAKEGNHGPAPTH